MKVDLNDYVSIKEFNKMVLQQRLDIVNKMLEKYDLMRINKHLGIEVDFLFWAFGYEFREDKFVARAK